MFLCVSFYEKKHDGRILHETDKFTDCLLRLPLFFELESDTIVSVLLKY